MPEFHARKRDRLDRFLREQEFTGCEWLSRQAWNFLVENGFISVNGRKCLKSGAEIAEGDRVALRFPRGPLGLLPGSDPAQIIASGPSLVALLKPCGVDTVPLFPWSRDSFANAAAAAIERAGLLSAPDFAALAEPPKLEGGLLQRLDRDTSGLVLAALDAPTKSLFRQLFSRSALEKTYEAIVSGDLSQLDGEHRIWLAGSSGPKVRAYAQPPQVEAETCTLLVKTLKKKGNAAYVEVRTHQGSRHIVRAGMASLGAPLVGDSTYGGDPGAPFHQLHASRLELREPEAFPAFPNNLHAPVPESFLDSLRRFGVN